MKRNSILLCIVFIITTNLFTTANAQVNTTDSLALVDLYNSTNGPNWRTNTKWLTIKPVSTWYGVVVTKNRVTQLNLGANKLSGPIPSSIGNLTGLIQLDFQSDHLNGSIPSSIGNLTNLTAILFQYNNFSGTIPASIGNLTNLTYLSLGVNSHLSGAIPPTIGNLINIKHLDLSVNKLSNPIPSSIGNLVNLNFLNLGGNQFNGPIPSAIRNLVNLTSLNLSVNKFKGKLPGFIRNLINLRDLNISSNRLSGRIPNFIGDITTLISLALNDNEFEGAIPDALGNLSNLNTLNLQINKLTGSIPASFVKLTNLYTLYLNFNQLSHVGNDIPSVPINSQVYGAINYNHFTFDGLEFIAKKYPRVYYAQQATIPIHQQGNILKVYAGGTLSNNTYTWYKVESNDSTIIKGDSTFAPPTSGQYYAKVTNAIATQLTLYTDTINYTMRATKQNNLIASPEKNTGNHFTVYPNPAKDVIHVQTNGTATFTLTNSNGKVLLTKTINTSDVINVSKYAGGTYYIQNKTTGETQKIVVVH